jgi:hypothetical protein
MVQNDREITVPLLDYKVRMRTLYAMGQCRRHTACTCRHWQCCYTLSNFEVYHGTWRGMHVKIYVVSRITMASQPSGTTLWYDVVECVCVT